MIHPNKKQMLISHLLFIFFIMTASTRSLELSNNNSNFYLQTVP